MHRHRELETQEKDQSQPKRQRVERIDSPINSTPGKPDFEVLTPMSEGAVILANFKNAEEPIEPSNFKAPSKKNYYTKRKVKLTDEELKTLTKDKRKWYAIINGVRTPVFTTYQLSHNRLFINKDTPPLTPEQEDAVIEKGRKRFIMIDGVETPVFTAAQLSNNRLFIDKDTRLTPEQELAVIKKDGERFIMIDGDKKPVFTAEQLSHLKKAWLVSASSTTSTTTSNQPVLPVREAISQFGLFPVPVEPSTPQTPEIANLLLKLNGQTTDPLPKDPNNQTNKSENQQLSNFKIKIKKFVDIVTNHISNDKLPNLLNDISIHIATLVNRNYGKPILDVSLKVTFFNNDDVFGNFEHIIDHYSKTISQLSQEQIKKLLDEIYIDLKNNFAHTLINKYSQVSEIDSVEPQKQII